MKWVSTLERELEWKISAFQIRSSFSSLLGMIDELAHEY
jgi:hypothetical protein